MMIVVVAEETVDLFPSLVVATLHRSLSCDRNDTSSKNVIASICIINYNRCCCGYSCSSTVSSGSCNSSSSISSSSNPA
jgi:hypothetical protein